MERLWEVTGGNPLALLEIPDLLTTGQLGGREAIDEPLPVGATIRESFIRRTRALPTDSQTALLVASASDTDDVAAIEAALRSDGLSAEALQPAETAALVSIDDGRLECGSTHFFARRCITRLRRRPGGARIGPTPRRELPPVRLRVLRGISRPRHLCRTKLSHPHSSAKRVWRAAETRTWRQPTPSSAPHD
jgi:hypothetical protein